MNKKSKKQPQYFFFPEYAFFPQVYYVGYIGLIVSVVHFFMGEIVPARVFLLISTIILLSRPWTLLSIRDNLLIDFFAFVPYRKIKLEQVKSIEVKETPVSQTFFSRGSESNFRYTIYKIILVTASEELVLQEGKQRKRLEQKAQVMASAGVWPFRNFTDREENTSN